MKVKFNGRGRNGKRGSTWISRSCTESMRRRRRKDQSVQPRQYNPVSTTQAVLPTNLRNLQKNFESGLVERRPASRRGFRDGCCPPAASLRLWRQLNYKLSACRRCWRFENKLRNMIRQHVREVWRWRAMMRDVPVSRFGEHERSGRGREAGTFAWVPR